MLRCALALALMGTIPMVGCGLRPRAPRATPDDCVPRFPYADGWLGGDAVYSVPVPGGEARRETIWLFGDSYVGEPGDRDREGSAFIHNSVARSTCGESGRFEISYGWKHDASGAPAAVFGAHLEPNYAWPFDGFFVADRLYVPLLEIAASEPSSDLGLAFEVRGTRVARVANPSDPIAAWQVDTRALGDGPAAILSTGVWVEDGFVHLLASPVDMPGTQPRFLVRVPLEAIEAWPDELTRSAETFTDRGTWEPGIDPTNARLLMRDNATEMSIDRDAETGLYFVVYSAPVQTADDGAASQTPALDGRSIFVRTAPALSGPWSARRRIYVMPEAVSQEDAEAGELEICYAAKAHAEQSPPGLLVVTYVCNLAPGPNGDVWRVLATMQRRMDIYRPQVLRQPWPLPEIEERAPLDEAPPRP